MKERLRESMEVARTTGPRGLHTSSSDDAWEPAATPARVAEQQLLHLGHRLLRVSRGAVGREFRGKFGLEDRFQHQHRGCHADPIPQG